MPLFHRYARQPRPVVVGSTRYRSTNEFCWGAWASVQRIPSRHEPSRYPAGGGHTYLPDYLWAAMSANGPVAVMIDIKSEEESAAELRRAIDASLQARIPLLVIQGPPSPGKYRITRTYSYGAEMFIAVDHHFRQHNDGTIHLYPRGSKVPNDDFWFVCGPGSMQLAWGFASYPPPAGPPEMIQLRLPGA